MLIGGTDMLKQKELGEKKKGGSVVFIICIVVILILLALIAYLLINQKRGEEPVNRNVVVNSENVERVLENLETEERVPVGNYEVTMNSTWNFAHGDSPSDNAYVENAKSNTNSVYFDVIRSDTEETIYESPILPVGSYLEDITLDKVLPAGTYDCLLIYHLLDDKNKSISTVKLTLTIVIAQ